MHAFNIFGTSGAHSDEIQKAKKKLGSMTSKNMYGHLKKGNYLAWSPNGEKLASGSNDETIRIWSNVDRKLQNHNDSQILKGHSAPVQQICWNPTNPEALASTSEDKTIRLWDVRSSSCVSITECKYEGLSLTWCPDGNSLIFTGKVNGGQDALLLVEQRKMRVRKILKFHYFVYGITWNNEGSKFYLATGPGCIEIWNSHEFKNIRTITVNSTPLHSITCAPNGKYYAVGGSDSLVSLWDVKDNVCLRTLDHLNATVKSLSISHDSQFIASGTEDSIIDISHVETGEHIHTIKNEAPVSCVVWHPSKHLLAYSGRDKDKHDRETGVIKVFGNMV